MNGKNDELWLMPTNVGINANLIILKFDGKEEEERCENG